MKILDDALYVLWAAPAGEEVPFEVSREVPLPLLPDCPTSPFCEDERLRRLRPKNDSGGTGPRAEVSLEMNPDFVFDPERCPYRFSDKDACYRNINRAALDAGCFPGRTVLGAANFLKALGYRVCLEKVNEQDLEGDRILVAHGPIYNFHELRCEHGPGGMVLYLIRNPAESDAPRGCVEI